MRGSMMPSLPMSVTARRFGSSASPSTTSRVKLKRSGTCQRPFVERGIERDLERREREPVALPPPAAYAKPFHGTDIIDAK